MTFYLPLCTTLQTIRFNIYAGSCVALALWREDCRWVPQTRYTLRRVYKVCFCV